MWWDELIGQPCTWWAELIGEPNMWWAELIGEPCTWWAELDLHVIGNRFAGGHRIA